MRKFVEDDGLSYKQISDILNQMFPGERGLSPMSVKRYCCDVGIHKTSRLNDTDLDVIVTRGIREV